MTDGSFDRQRSLIRLVRLSIATIALNAGAWALTGSVGLLSDAAESLVNLVAALFALVVVHWAPVRPTRSMRTVTKG